MSRRINMANHILVLGGGELGTEILKALASHPSLRKSEITVLQRSSLNPSDKNVSKRKSAQELVSLGIKSVAADLTSMSTSELSQIFKHYHTIIGCTGFSSTSGTQLKVAHAVLEAGTVARYIPWQFGVDYDAIGRNSGQALFDEQLDVRDLLRSQQRTSWIIISTGMFTSFLFDPTFNIVDLKNKVVHALGSWEMAVTVTAVEDIGKLTTEILASEEPEFKDVVVYTAGETVTYGRLACIVEDLSGEAYAREELSLEYLKKQLDKEPDNSLYRYRYVFAKGGGVSWETEKSFNHKKNISTPDVKEWARSHIFV